MTKFKDVAHLYNGCELYSKATGDMVGTLEGVVCNKAHFRVRGVWASADISYYKPAIRPLDSMTEEEEYDLEMLGHQLIIKKVCSNVFHAERTKYLLSKHFDLFSLIPNGEAIDKTKTTQNG